MEREAEIVAQSGRLGAVTIATNMAGRGTDIILGGNAEFMARLKLREMLMPRYFLSIDKIFYTIRSTSMWYYFYSSAHISNELALDPSARNHPVLMHGNFILDCTYVCPRSFM